MATQVFFGYPSRPEVRRETLAVAATYIGSLPQLEVRTWEALGVGGRILIDAILEAIDGADLTIFDITALSSNVLFELGYAIGHGKQVWATFDQSDQSAKDTWKQFRTLTTLGYAPYANADDIRGAFLADMPHTRPTTIFEDLIEHTLPPASQSTLFYIPSAQETEPARQLTRFLHKDAQGRGLSVTVTDPDEAAFYTLPWYARQIYNSVGVVLHFGADWRVGSRLYNPRSAMIAGLAVGMGRQILMLAEEDYSDPLDYRDFLFVYPNIRSLLDHATTWTQAHLPSREEVLTSRAEPTLRLGAELRSLRLGEPVAENEADALSDYFIETANYVEVLRRGQTVFVGRKGTGKTANMIRAAEQLRADSRNLVVVIKPYGYELQGLLRLLRGFDERDLKSYLIETLWKYLLYTEIAKAARDEFVKIPLAARSGTPQQQLFDYVDDPRTNLTDDFAVRLEAAVTGLDFLESGSSLGEERRTISEQLHRGVLREIRRRLSLALTEKRRVAVLVDNLDKAWDKSGELDQLARMILGLLVSVGRLGPELENGDRREPLGLTLAVFLRSDIYRHVARVAREPDKIPVTTILWNNPDTLLRLIEQRYVAGRERGTPGSELWERFFAPDVQGQGTKDYILSRILARPRDLVYFCNEAVTAAVNAGHTVVETTDIESAERIYSQFAFEAILVENGLSMAQVEDVLYEFAGFSNRIPSSEAQQAIQRGGISPERVETVLTRLRELSFLGVEVDEGRFSYEDSPSAMARDDVLARKLAVRLGREVRLEIHPAFRPYLEVGEDSA